MCVRLCVVCKHFDVSEGDHGYSELTPGWDAHIGCGRGKWSMDNFDIDTRRFRAFIHRALTCDEFAPAEDAEEVE